MKNLLKNKFINKLCVKIVNIAIPIKSIRQNLRQQIQYIRLEDFKYKFSAKYPDYYQFVMFQPWGDFYITASLLSEFKKNNNDAKILAVCVNQEQKNVLETFGAINKIEIITKEFYNELLSINSKKNFKQQLEKGKLYCLSHWYYSDADKNQSYNFLELYTKMLGLKYPTKLMVSNTLNSKTASNNILIYPEANSFDYSEITQNFWVSLADELTYMGYNVIFNSKKQTYGKYQTIFYSMNKSIELAKQCKFVIGTRSGFGDILAINKVKNHIVVYPPNLYFRTIPKEQQEKEFKRAFVIKEEETFEENMKRITSLKMFNDYATEIYFTDETTVKNKIFKSIQGEKDD